ncbi:MAG: methyltransferase domain-containing protein [Candidatus Saccharimonas sp.]
MDDVINTLQSYESFAYEYAESRKDDNVAHYCRWIIKALASISGDSEIFEIGSGPGLYADYFESQGYSIVRSDGAQSFVDMSHARGVAMAKFDVVADVFAQSYDAVLAINVMQHLKKDEAIVAFGKIYAALNQRGRFIFTITIGDGNSEIHNRQTGGYYFLNWPVESLRQALVAAGFSIISMQEVGYKNWMNIVVEKPDER